MIITTGTYFIIDANVADTLGIHEAFVLARIDYWLSLYQSKRSKYEKDHFMNGRWWTYETVDELTDQIKWCSRHSIVNAIKNLKDQNIIVVSHFGERFDRTNWYTINYELLFQKVREEHPEIDELNENNKWSLDSSLDGQSDSSRDEQSIYINNNINKKSKNTLIRGVSVSLTFPEIPEEDQGKSKARVLELNDRINEVYPVKDGIATGLKAISDIVRYCTSYQELDTYLGGIWHGFNLKLIEYKNDKRNQDLEREQIDYRYFPKLENLINDNFTNPTVGYFADGIKKYRLQKMKEGDGNAG